ncbi:uncharacterized protein N7477_009049 [Penicillium maclennaniae]|uniref:uncharacterized protein n=1 Tax=Penicillium maclennaniae TaxID=1343394 RepID=UPI002541A329|nr:uncharacterized protein N7477_009049 [Penicillium maclennaniae]KAJ5661433.1 hypothetical protein N7477_009049 [Penicillium maclennaniae]
MAVRCSACGQWIKTTGGAHNCPGGGKANEDLPALLNKKQNEAFRNIGDADPNCPNNAPPLHSIVSISATYEEMNCESSGRQLSCTHHDAETA